MYVTTQAKHDALAQGMSQLFKPIYETEFRHQYHSELDFYRNNVWFFTLTYKQSQISLLDRFWLATTDCFYERLTNEQSNSFVALNSKNISELRHLAKKHKISGVDALPKIDLIFAIQDKLGIKHEANFHRPIVAVRPKPHPLKVFEHLHFNIARACLGSNLQRKLRYQPIALAYVDFEGTRNGASVDPTKSEWIHAHAVMFVRPKQTGRFNGYTKLLIEHFETKKAKRKINKLNNIERQLGLTSEQQSHRLDLHKLVRSRAKLRLQGDLAALHDIKIEPYNQSNPLANLLGYSSKGVDQVPTHFVRHNNRVCEGIYSGADDLYEMFPRQLMNI